jgi:hypothetical protein
MVSSEQIYINISLIDLSKIPHEIAREAQLAQIYYNKPFGCRVAVFSACGVHVDCCLADKRKCSHCAEKTAILLTIVLLLRNSVFLFKRFPGFLSDRKKGCTL